MLARYERIAFEKPLVAPPGQPLAAFVCPGHPLLDATLDLTLERHRDLLRRGTVLVDDRDPGTAPRVLFFLEHSIQDASLTRGGEQRVVSRRVLYVEIDAEAARVTCITRRIWTTGRSARPSRVSMRCSRVPSAHGSAATSKAQRSRTRSPPSCPNICARSATAGSR